MGIISTDLIEEQSDEVGSWECPACRCAWDTAEQAGACCNDLDPPDCPACGAESAGSVLGTLGRLDWFRCRDCGIDFSRSASGELVAVRAVAGGAS